ncbi:MAG: very short patch repair endonuclease [Rhabdochlamydiaceae bacterium]
MDIFTKAERSMIMSKIRSKNTTPERVLFTELHKRGVKFQRHYKLIGRPDMAFPKDKLAVFIDGDFWHGYNWKVKMEIPPEIFWQPKISSNMKRDRKVRKELSKIGWKVMRIWEHDVKKNPSGCAARIISKLRSV